MLTHLPGMSQKLLERASRAQRARLAVLGSGVGSFELALAEATRHHPRQIAYRRGYDEPLSHRIMAGSDFILVPSRFEPCGLT